jgi:hypothetical protein
VSRGSPDRPFFGTNLIGLHEADEIPYRKLGTYCRIRFGDLASTGGGTTEAPPGLGRTHSAERGVGLYWPMAHFVVCDADVFYPNTLRDLMTASARPA